ITASPASMIHVSFAEGALIHLRYTEPGIRALLSNRNTAPDQAPRHSNFLIVNAPAHRTPHSNKDLNQWPRQWVALVQGLSGPVYWPRYIRVYRYTLESLPIRRRIRLRAGAATAKVFTGVRTEQPIRTNNHESQYLRRVLSSGCCRVSQFGGVRG